MYSLIQPLFTDPAIRRDQTEEEQQSGGWWTLKRHGTLCVWVMRRVKERHACLAGNHSGDRLGQSGDVRRPLIGRVSFQKFSDVPNLFVFVMQAQLAVCQSNRLELPHCLARLIG